MIYYNIIFTLSAYDKKLKGELDVIIMLYILNVVYLQPNFLNTYMKSVIIGFSFIHATIKEYLTMVIHLITSVYIYINELPICT